MADIRYNQIPLAPDTEGLAGRQVMLHDPNASLTASTKRFPVDRFVLASKPFTATADTSFDLKTGEVLEFVCLKNAGTLDIKIGTSSGGNDLFAGDISDAQPIVLMYYADVNKTIYITGITSSTTVKVKIS